MKTKSIVKIGFLIVMVYIIFNVSGCASTKTQKTVDSSTLDSLVAQKSMLIESQRAFPNVTNSLVSISNSGLLPPGDSAGSISLIGNPNYLKIKGDSVSGYLPYFGERQMGAYPGNNDTGIEFNGLAKKYRVKNGKKNSYIIQFTISDKAHSTEQYNITLRLYPNLKSNIRVNSSQRFSIEYLGNLSSINK